MKSRGPNPRPPRSFYKRYDIAESPCGEKPVYTISRRNVRNAKRLLYFHGGGYALEILGLQWNMARRILERADVELTVPIYPLAPEHTCIEVLDFASAVYRTLCDSSDAEIIILGDSSGGGLALALAQRVRDDGGRQPAGLVLISPWLDVTCTDSAQPALNAKDPMLSIPMLREEGRWYAGDLSPTDARVSPIYGDLDGLPPILLLTGTHDVLNADARRLNAKMASTAGSLQMIEAPGMLHVWPSLPIPEATIAIDDIAAFVHSC